MFQCKSFRESSTKCQHINWLPMSTDKTIGHFRVPKTLNFKMRLGAQPFLWKWVLFAWEWKPFPYQRLSTYPRFETEARGNSDMAYCVQSNSGVARKVRREDKKRKGKKNTNHIMPWSYLSVTKQGIDKEIDHYRVAFQASFWKRGKVRCLSHENNFLVVRAIFVWPWNENARTKQKQQTSGNKAIWLVYRTATNAPLVG